MDVFNVKEEFAIVKVVSQKEELVYFLSKVTKSKEENLEVETLDAYSTSSLKELKKEIQDLPVILNFLGNNILYTDNDYLFNSSEDNFYATQFLTKKGKKLSALIRRELIDNVISNFLSNDFFIVDMYVGVFSFLLLHEKDYLEEEFLTISGVNLNFKNGDLIEFGANGLELTKSKETNPSEKVLVLSLVLNIIYPSEKIDNTYINESIIDNKLDLRHRKIFLQVSKYGTALLFILIAIGYFLGLFFTKKNKSINEELSIEKVKNERFINLKKKENRKKEMLLISGFNKKDLLTYYVNETIKTKPFSVVLSDLKIFVADKKYKKGKKINIENKQILVEGVFTEGEEFNNWINKIKSKIQIETINITKFKKTKVSTDFELEIYLK